MAEIIESEYLGPREAIYMNVENMKNTEPAEPDTIDELSKALEKIGAFWQVHKDSTTYPTFTVAEGVQTDLQYATAVLLVAVLNRLEEITGRLDNITEILLK